VYTRPAVSPFDAGVPRVSIARERLNAQVIVLKSRAQGALDEPRRNSRDAKRHGGWVAVGTKNVVTFTSIDRGKSCPCLVMK
jgi:hypothetical protein